jgi:hypothetical protein
MRGCSSKCKAAIQAASSTYMGIYTYMYCVYQGRKPLKATEVY